MDAAELPRLPAPVPTRSARLLRRTGYGAVLGLLSVFILTPLVLLVVVVGSVSQSLGQWTDALGSGRPVSDDPTPVTLTVAPGASASSIGEELERRGLIRSAVAFRVQAETRRVAGRLAAGKYELRRTMSVGEILDLMASGRSAIRQWVTIPEGWRAEEIAQYLERRRIMSAASFLDLVAGQGDARGPPLPEGVSSFEGYLFPDTYDFGPDPTPERVLGMLLGQFHHRVGPELRRRAAERGLSVHELVTLASIIEREAVQPDERPRISAVYHNRLARGMPLQADPTTQYALVPFGALWEGVPFWKAKLDPEDLAIDSPYNTYRGAGLPPGPICNPGMASIEAAADPEDGLWLYFVARADGFHLFARTLDEHLQNIARVSREAAERPL